MFNDIRFKLAHWELEENSFQDLESYVAFLIRNPNLVIEIQVHTDSRGSTSSSRNLPQRRAKAISEYFVAKGLDEFRFLPRGYGESRPFVEYKVDLLNGDTLSKQVLTEAYINQFKNKDPEKYEMLHQKNRRVEFVILSTDYRPFVTESEKLQIKFLDSIQGELLNYSIDNFGNIYTTNKDVIVKYSPQLDTLFSSSLKSLVPTSIESSKSFRVLVFDKERGVINFLDNTLTDVKGEIDLADLDVLQAVLVCESFNGNTFWVLDEGGQQLLKLNQNLEIISRVDNLNFLFDKKESPIQMFEHNDELVIHFPNYGIATFDVFGTYLKFYPINSTWINIENNYLFSLKKDKINVFHLPLMEDYSILNLPDSNYTTFQIVNQKLYLKSKATLQIFSINETTNNK